MQSGAFSAAINRPASPDVAQETSYPFRSSTRWMNCTSFMLSSMTTIRSRRGGIEVTGILLMGARLGKGWTVRVTYPAMRLILGLGNPGQQYARSRHNAGFRVLDAFARKFRIDFDTHEKDAMTGRGRVGGGAVLVAKPQTFMNNSGHAARLLLAAYGERPDDLMIVYDEVDLPLGSLRIRPSGSSGTHNGMRSIVEALATESFPRLRFGVRGERYAESRELD